MSSSPIGSRWLEGLRHAKRLALRRWEGVALLRQRYERLHGRPLSDAPPQRFSEHLFQRLLHTHRHGNAQHTALADKVLAREHVRARTGGDQHLTQLFWHGADPRQLPFDDLPARCIIKTNHGSGGHQPWSAGADRSAIVRQLQADLGRNFYWESREYHYAAIPPQALVEEWLDDGTPDGPRDYRVWCFHGEPVMVQVDNHSHTLNAFYSPTWRLLNLRTRHALPITPLPRPTQLPALLQLARQLAAGIDFVRVDLYQVGERVLFGEMTFTPGGGRVVFDPPVWDDWLGQCWTHPAPREIPDDCYASLP